MRHWLRRFWDKIVLTERALRQWPIPRVCGCGCGKPEIRVKLAKER